MSNELEVEYISLAKNILILSPEELVKRYNISENKAKRIKREFTLLLKIEKDIFQRRNNIEPI
jgi:hypothetical protein